MGKGDKSRNTARNSQVPAGTRRAGRKGAGDTKVGGKQAGTNKPLTQPVPTKKDGIE